MFGQLWKIVVFSGVPLSICPEGRAQTKSETQEIIVKKRLAQLDEDSDGKISRGEAPGRMKRFFDRIDTGQDGFIDLGELQRVANRQNRQRPQNNRSRQAMSTERLLASAPDGVVVEPDITYREGESQAWQLDLVRPEQDGVAPRPAIVFIHGGGWRSGDKRRGFFIRGAMEYARKGYVCVSVNYRLTGEARFPACIEDVKCAVRWLRSNAKKYNVDPERIGGYGNSAGAHLVAMLGLAGPDAGLEGDGPHQDQSSLLQAVCCSATPTDMTKFERVFGASRSATPEQKTWITQRARQCSPITYVSEKAPPFLVVHGTGDRTVDVEHGDKFVKALKDAGAEHVEYIRIEDAGHGVFNQHAKQTRPAMEKFFAKHLKGK